MDIVIPFKYIRNLIIGLLLSSIPVFILWVITSFYVLKWFQMKIDKEIVYFNEYNEDSKKILEKYGEKKIKNIYLVRHPIQKITSMLLNMSTFYKYREKLNKSLPSHTFILLEIKDKDFIKRLIIEKNNYLKISECYEVNSSQIIKRLKLKREIKNKTLNEILETTKDRMGNEKYFNWHLYRNNCHNITKEILITLKAYNKKNREFICDKYEKEIIPEFNLYLINAIHNIYNIVESITGIKFEFFHGGKL